MLKLWQPFNVIPNALSQDNLLSRRIPANWDLFEDIWSIHDKMLQTFDKINYFETKSGDIEVTIDVPGVKLEDININAKDNYIIVDAKRKISKDNSESYKSIYKEFAIPEKYDINSVQAQLSDGVLTLTMNKLPKQDKKQRKIEVQVK